MRSRTRCARSGLLFAVVGLFALPAASASAADDDGLAELMAELSRTGSVSARFTESKQLALLSEPLSSEGSIYFAPPDRFARYTTLPGQSSLLLHGDDLVFRDETGQEHFDLSQNDVARQLVGSLIDVLRGDLAALKKNYTVDFQHAEESWRLELKPRSNAAGHFIETVRIEGVGREVQFMEVLDPSGDRTTTTFHDFKAGSGFSEKELESLFSPGSRIPNAGPGPGPAPAPAPAPAG